MGSWKSQAQKLEMCTPLSCKLVLSQDFESTILGSLEVTKINLYMFEMKSLTEVKVGKGSEGMGTSVTVLTIKKEKKVGLVSMFVIYFIRLG